MRKAGIYVDRYLNLEVEDSDERQAGLQEQLASAVQFFRSGVEAGGGCLVHCAAGVSRSAAVVVACLMSVHRFTLREALAAVRERRPIAWPNDGLLEELAVFEVYPAPPACARHARASL